jgi:adenosylmethionine-8-amino-7-oxononanoate aminotransferase
MCLGKGLTGGYLPMAVTVANRRVYQQFFGPDLSERTLYHGHSFGGNALAAAVALKHLELLLHPAVLENVRERSAQLRRALRVIQQRASVRDTRLIGLMGAVELDTRADARLPRRTCAAMVRRGVLSRSLGSVVTLAPPLTVTAAEIERIVAVLDQSLAETCA